MALLLETIDWDGIDIIDVDKDNFSEITGLANEHLIAWTGIEAYTKDYTYTVTGNNFAPIITINSNDGVVHMRRKIILDEKIIDNTSITVTRTGTGIGRKIFKKQIEEAKNAGFEKIECIAGENKYMNGYYTWARFGFISDEFNNTRIQMHLKEKGYEGDEVKPHLIVKTEYGCKWWMKNGTVWSGYFDLSNNSESMNIFIEYDNSKE